MQDTMTQFYCRDVLTGDGGTIRVQSSLYLDSYLNTDSCLWKGGVAASKSGFHRSHDHRNDPYE